MTLVHKAMVQQTTKSAMPLIHHAPEGILSASHESFTGQQRLFMDLAKRGDRARKQRSSINASLEKIAKRAGLSLGKASEIERGIAVPNEQFVLDFEKALKIEAKRVLLAAAAILVDEELA